MSAATRMGPTSLDRSCFSIFCESESRSESQGTGSSCGELQGNCVRGGAACFRQNSWAGLHELRTLIPNNEFCLNPCTRGLCESSIEDRGVWFEEGFTLESLSPPVRRGTCRSSRATVYGASSRAQERKTPDLTSTGHEPCGAQNLYFKTCTFVFSYPLVFEEASGERRAPGWRCDQSGPCAGQE